VSVPELLRPIAAVPALIVPLALMTAVPGCQTRSRASTPVATAASSIVFRCGDGLANLCRTTAAGNRYTRLTTDGSTHRSYTFPSLSRNGRRLVFTFGGRVYEGDALARNRTALRVRGRISDIAQWADSKVALSATLPCGACQLPQVVIIGARTRGAIQVPAFQLDWVDERRLVAILEAISLHLLSPPKYRPQKVFATARSLLDPDVAPNGDDVVLAEFDSRSRSRLVVFKLSRRAIVRRLTMGPRDRHPSWSPDGKSVVFVRNFADSETGGALFTVDRFGRNIRPLGIRGSEPTWGAAP
jgi:WD40-like Beta Propeller Repeat